MNPEQDLWSTSTTELMGAFRAALTALVPTLDRCRIAWRKPEAYDDWDEISGVLYRTIVAASIASRVGADPAAAEFATYGASWTNDAKHSLITVKSNRLTEQCVCWAFIEFETDLRPFDTVRCVAMNECYAQVGERVVDVATVEFAAAVRVRDSVSFVSTVVVQL